MAGTGPVNKQTNITCYLRTMQDAHDAAWDPPCPPRAHAYMCMHLACGWLCASKRSIFQLIFLLLNAGAARILVWAVADVNCGIIFFFLQSLIFLLQSHYRPEYCIVYSCMYAMIPMNRSLFGEKKVNGSSYLLRLGLYAPQKQKHQAAENVGVGLRGGRRGVT